jgi:acyl carrier protein
MLLQCICEIGGAAVARAARGDQRQQRPIGAGEQKKDFQLPFLLRARRTPPSGLFDESAISSVGQADPLAGKGKLGETMHSRAPQFEFDANKVRALIAKYLGIDAERVTDEAHFSDFGLDSLDQLELLILIEEEFSGVEFSDAAVDRIEVVGDLIRYIEITCLLGGLYVQAFRRSAA